ncbi:hypothetical protein ACET3Z_027374 [Daucus carota]
MGCRCLCGKMAVEATAWTSNNAGRRFRTCADRRCRFFAWIDPPMCERAKIVIQGLIRRINNLEGSQNINYQQLDEGSQGKAAPFEAEVETEGVQGRACSTSLFLLIVTWFSIFVFFFFSD